jgi:hypothetical protein
MASSFKAAKGRCMPSKFELISCRTSSAAARSVMVLRSLAILDIAKSVIHMALAVMLRGSINSELHSLRFG